jgi:hypothetical protein
VQDEYSKYFDASPGYCGIIDFNPEAGEKPIQTQVPSVRQKGLLCQNVVELL